MTEEVCEELEDLQSRSFVDYRIFSGNLESLYEHSLKCFAAGHDELFSVTLKRRELWKNNYSIGIFSPWVGTQSPDYLSNP